MTVGPPNPLSIHTEPMTVYATSITHSVSTHRGTAGERSAGAGRTSVFTSFESAGNLTAGRGHGSIAARARAALNLKGNYRLGQLKSCGRDAVLGRRLDLRDPFTSGSYPLCAAAARA